MKHTLSALETKLLKQKITLYRNLQKEKIRIQDVANEDLDKVSRRMVVAEIIISALKRKAGKK